MMTNISTLLLGAGETICTGAIMPSGGKGGL